ncbi:MAG TPA: hypothetical protein P5523_07365 [Bacteroidales bacterium]|nr:hypothetical protein [Bacteroidales bacterium]
MKKILEFKDKDEYDAYMSKVDEKIKNSQSLSEEEIDNFCFALPYKEKLKFAFCDDDRFEYLFLHHIDNGVTRPKLTPEQNLDLDKFANNWEEFLKKPRSKNPADNHIKDEYLSEINNLRKDYKDKPDDEESKKSFNLKKMEILWYNKYIYLKGQNIFTGYELPIRMVIDGRTIFIDEYIFYHSLIRHYGEIIKQTTTVKSYFTEDVLVEDLYNLITALFDKLQEKKTTLCNILSIRFKYKSKYYQLYTKKIIKNNKQIEFRINSFFPIEDTTRIQEIMEDYNEVPLDDRFTYLEKKENSND